MGEGSGRLILSLGTEIESIEGSGRLILSLVREIEGVDSDEGMGVETGSSDDSSTSEISLGL